MAGRTRTSKVAISAAFAVALAVGASIVVVRLPGQKGRFIDGSR
jgi:hypothetical protein